MPLTLDNTTRAFLPASLAVPKHTNNKTVGDSLCNGIPLSPSPTSVITKKLKEPPADVKIEVAFSRKSGNYANPLHQNYEREENQHQNYPMQTKHQPNHHQLQQHQLQNQPQYKLENLLREHQLQNQQQQYTLQNQHQQPQNPLQEYPLQNQQQHCQHPNEFQQEMEFDCLHPRDDHRSRVRFSQSLSVYDNFEDFDYSDADCSPQSTTRKMLGVNKENNECKLMFMLQRAKHCWYSRGELKRIKSERKEIVRALRRVNFDVGSIDQSMYDLRGLEAYLSVSFCCTRCSSTIIETFSYHTLVLTYPLFFLWNESAARRHSNNLEKTQRDLGEGIYGTGSAAPIRRRETRSRKHTNGQLKGFGMVSHQGPGGSRKGCQRSTRSVSLRPRGSPLDE